jgi:hydrogenase nickel incorporation protein HypA/HybF
MHELSIAVQIVEIAEDELLRHGGDRVRSVHVQLGALSGVAKEALQFSFGIACEGTTAEGASLVIEHAEGHELDVLRMEIEP